SPHSSRFLNEAKKPFHSYLLHPSRGTPRFSCQDVKTASDAHDEIELAQGLFMGVEKNFFLWRTHGDKKKLRPAFRNFVDHFLFFCLREITVVLSGHQMRREFFGKQLVHLI